MQVLPFQLAWDFILGRQSEQELLKAAGTSDRVALSVAMLEDAVERQHANDVECALGVIFRLHAGSPDHRPLLVALSDTRWHHSHEDVVGLLDGLRDESLVDVLVRATQWLPEYMAYDEDNRSLARKAIYALSNLPGATATEALRELARAPHPRLRELALRKLAERGSTSTIGPA